MVRRSPGLRFGHEALEPEKALSEMYTGKVRIAILGIRSSHRCRKEDLLSWAAVGGSVVEWPFVCAR